jgi:hypothetical protein
MSTRQVVGIVLAVVGLAISIGHLVFAIFDRIPEKYHSHQAIVVIGFALVIGGLLLLGTDKRR